ncbi:hypothetical protein An07g00990 [Aspergillus niger]|uniref:Uncharacterized protein n=2 Tax=Aspergillus niger TaxID=5061 RepID=A2QM66_ASPNC|nr:hypothetical protein An07g00990 [Aspergillus niger]CAK96547.1 hypothetical protein An07g00990 [Aspergillus niger]
MGWDGMGDYVDRMSLIKLQRLIVSPAFTSIYSIFAHASIAPHQHCQGKSNDRMAVMETSVHARKTTGSGLGCAMIGVALACVIRAYMTTMHLITENCYYSMFGRSMIAQMPITSSSSPITHPRALAPGSYFPMYASHVYNSNLAKVYLPSASQIILFGPGLAVISS